MRIKDGKSMLGGFRYAESNQTALNGVLHMERGRPVVEVSGSFTDRYEVVGREPGGVTLMRPASDDNTDLTLHGSLSDPPRAVTIFDGRSVQRSSRTETVHGEYVVVGAHVANSSVGFTEFQFRVSGVEQWFDFPTSILATRHRDNGGRYLFEGVSLTSEDASDVVELASQGELRLQQSIILPAFPGSPLRTVIDERAWLHWSPTEPWSIQRFMSHVAIPVADLMTLASSQECHVEEVAVRFGESARWLPVQGVGISGLRDVGHSSNAFNARDFEPGAIGSWIDQNARLSPIAQIVSGSVSGKNKVLEVDALLLCTAMEGLHKRLHGEVRIPTKDGERKPYFKERVEKIANETVHVLPEIAACRPGWLSFVGVIRNGQAHQGTDNKVDEEHLHRIFVLTCVLRYILTCRILLEAGADPEKIRGRLSRDGKYSQLQRNIAYYHPEAY